ncbi:hypothetical protein ACGF07_00650 [Kitasatospora sp. NPDC048194]|uniref:hypothetical protein n=1 Tax=Kitasatospora sp. NPDC048194 TaxID=3364045 RepID=UPI00371C7A8D
MIRRHRRFLLTLAAGALLLGAPIQYGYDARHQAHAAVTDFNDGFADSKRDDCEQGFVPACQWLDAR